MGFVASVLILVAAGLLLVAASMASRASGRAASPWTIAAMAAMFGLAIGFLFRVLWISPLGLFPVALAAMLIADWVHHRRGRELGAFLTGAGALWVWGEVSSVINDLSDEAVTIPGWTPIPLAVSLIALVFGAALLALSARSGHRPP